MRLKDGDRLHSVGGTGLTNVADETMDRLAALVARLLQVPIALISLVDDHREFFPGQHGLAGWLADEREMPLEQSICRVVVERGTAVQIDDLAAAPE